LLDILKGMRPIPFNYAVSKILNSGRKFNHNGLLRFALLGLFDDKKKNTMVDMDAIFEFKTIYGKQANWTIGNLL
jgi:hypothetical protein